jgi:DNA-binding transcriptional LysR family regulator
VDGWPGVEPRHLAALAAVHDERSFRAAADRLGYVQSAVSLQISQLERLVGTRLVDRERGHAPPVRLTAAGALLLEHGASILAQLGGAQDDLRASDAPVLRLGVPRGAASIMMGSRFDVVVAACDRELLALVATGEVDAALAEPPQEDDTLESTGVLDDPIMLLVPASDPRQAVTSAADLLATPLIECAGRPLPAGAEALLRAGDDAIAQSLVGAGCGAALLPALAIAPGDPATRALPTGDLLPPRRLALCHRPGQGPIASPALLDSIAGAAASSATLPR